MADSTRSGDAAALPGDTSQRGSQAGDDRGVFIDTNGITDGMVERAAEQIYGGPKHRYKAEDGGDLVEYTVAWNEVTEKLGIEERVVYLRQARRILEAALAGRTVLDLPKPTAWRNRIDGDVDIWPIGGWSVTASPDGVGISTSRDGFGGGLGFRDGQAPEIGAALIAAHRRLAAKQSSEASGGVL